MKAALKIEFSRILEIVLGLEVLLFLLPSNGKIEGVATGYWDGVKLRFSSGHYWVFALTSGLGIAVLLFALVAFEHYIINRFVTPFSNKDTVDEPHSK
ncbi:MAG: hypothetical protein WA639_20720 [Candidatus Acidiferrum sp.]